MMAGGLTSDMYTGHHERVNNMITGRMKSRRALCILKDGVV
jgi:hypothetical protein